MEFIGQFFLFCAGMYASIVALRIISLTFRYWIARRIIALQLQNAVMIHEKISPRDKIIYDPEIELIVEQIFIQMVQNLKYQRKWMIRHAIEHFAVLYQSNIWLLNDPDDLKLYAALDVIKQKFYYMHGTFVNIKKNNLRNHINMELMTTSGTPLTSVEEVAEFDKKKHGAGSRVCIVISIVTPLTSKNYDYFRHL
uniref:Uncharacterized protein n=1 Tax=Burkholderia phage vB_BgluM-SURPRISE13 TaxID=3159457 RepID=A0AAU7PFD4_9VIRU